MRDHSPYQTGFGGGFVKGFSRKGDSEILNVTEMSTTSVKLL